MRYDLIYTSAPRGLKAGSYGFCTVAFTEGMPANCVSLCESLSAYDFVYKPHEEGYKQSPVGFSHLRFTVGGQSYSVLSRIGTCRSDYSGRSNFIAHHVMLRPDDRERLTAGPAWVLQRMRDQQHFCSEWAGDPRYLHGEPEIKPLPSGRGPDSRVAKTWLSRAGHAGHAAVMAQHTLDSPDKPYFLVYKPDLPDLLDLLVESMALLPPARRWDVTFSTFAHSLPRSADCTWRCCLPGAEALKASRRIPGAVVLDLTRLPLPTPPVVPLTDTACQEGAAPFWDQEATVRLPMGGAGGMPAAAAAEVEAGSPRPTLSLPRRPATSSRPDLPKPPVAAAAPPAGREGLPPAWRAAGVVAAVLIMAGVLTALVVLRRHAAGRQPGTPDTPGTTLAAKPGPARPPLPAAAETPGAHQPDKPAARPPDDAKPPRPGGEPTASKPGPEPGQTPPAAEPGQPEPAKPAPVDLPLPRGKPLRLLSLAAADDLLRAAPITRDTDKSRVQVHPAPDCEPKLAEAARRGPEVKHKAGAGLTQVVSLVVTGNDGAVRLERDRLTLTGNAREQIDAIVLDDRDVLWLGRLDLDSKALQYDPVECKGTVTLGHSATARLFLHCLRDEDLRRDWLLKARGDDLPVRITEVSEDGFQFALTEEGRGKMASLTRSLEAKLGKLQEERQKVTVGADWDAQAKLKEIKKDYDRRRELLDKKKDEKPDGHRDEVSRALAELLKQCVAVLAAAGAENEVRNLLQGLLNQLDPKKSKDSPFREDESGHEALRQSYGAKKYADTVASAVTGRRQTLGHLGELLTIYPSIPELCAKAGARGPELAKRLDAQIAETKARLASAMQDGSKGIAEGEFAYKGQVFVAIGKP